MATSLEERLMQRMNAPRQQVKALSLEQRLAQRLEAPARNQLGGVGGIVDQPVDPERAKIAWLQENLASGNIEPTPKSFFQKVQAELPQIVGEEVGALSGGLVGARAASRIPAGHPLLKGAAIAGGAMLGAGLGAMGVTGIEQTFRMNKPGAKSMSLNEIYKEQLWSGAEGVISEGLGRGVVGGGSALLKTGVGQRALAPVKNIAIPHIEKLNAILKQAGATLPPEEAAKLTAHAQDLLTDKGVFLTAAQSTRGRAIDWVENATESSIFGGNRLFQLKRFLQPASFKNAVKQMSDRFWGLAGERMSIDETGKLFVDTITGKRTAQKAMARTAYKQVDELTTGAVIDFRATKKLAEQLSKTAGASKNLGQQRGIRTLANKVANWADNPQGFMQGHGMISDLGDEVRRLEALGGGTKLPKVSRAAKMLDAEATKAMRNAAKTQGPDALTALDAAQVMVRQGKEVLNNETINSAMKLATRKPERVINQVFTKNGVDTLRAVKQATDKKTYRTLLAAKLDDIITKNSGTVFETTGVPSGKGVLENINKTLGEDMLKEMFESPTHLQDFLDVMNLGFVLETQNTAGGGMVVQLMQAGGLADIATKLPIGESPRAASWLINIGPALIGRLFSNPTGAKWLSTGFKLTGTAQDKWFAKIPPSISRILREGTQEPRPKSKRAIPSARELRGFGGRGF